MQTRIIPETDIQLESNNVIESFKKDFISIKSKGEVVSRRPHDTGIGKTFEDLIGVEENNNSLVDYKGILELKSARELSPSMVTLFTKSPTYPRGVNTHLRETYGHPDPEYNNIKILHTTISASNFNTYKNKYGFKLKVDDENEKIFIFIKNLRSGETISDEIYYTFEELKEIVEIKCKFIAYIEADTRKSNGKEYFKFKKAYLLSGLTFEKFIDYVKQGLIVYDIRIGAYKTGSNKGKTHDHGSGFRILKRNLYTIFNVEEI